MTEEENTEEVNEETTEETTEDNTEETTTPSLLDEETNPDTQDSIKFEDGVKPEGFPEEFWDEENNALKPEELYNQYVKTQGMVKGLREKLSKKGGAPENATDYKLAVDEEWGLTQEEVAEDPTVQKFMEVAHENGISQEAFAPIFKNMMTELKAQAENAQPAEMTEEQLEEFKAQEYKKIGPNAPAVIKAVTEFGRQLEAQGVFGERDMATMKAHAYDGDFVIMVNKLREMVGGNRPVPMAVDDTGESGLPSMKEIHDMIGNATNDDEMKKAEGLIARRAQAGLSTEISV